MAIVNKIGYGYNDLTIIPAMTSKVNSRKDVNVFYNDGKLPIFVSPMSTITNVKNFHLWESNDLIPILPRNIDLEIRKDYIMQGKWVALSLSEFENLIIKNTDLFFSVKPHILIDIANGHMTKLGNLCRTAKKKYGDNIVLMCGNIANPRTYTLVSEAGVDYVRCSIGSGSCCTTSSNTGVHYPIASLIDEINSIKNERKKSGDFYSKVIADGGIKNFNDVIKALALGADYVMIGGLFNTILESAAEPIDGTDVLFNNNMYKKHIDNIISYYPDIDLNDKLIIRGDFGYEEKIKTYMEKYANIDGLDIVISQSKNNDLYQGYGIFDVYNENLPEHIKRYLISHNIKKETYGMSTKYAQSLIKDSKDFRTSEGCHKTVEVKYTLKQWVENMKDYLRSAMSYCNSFTLYEFIGNQNLIINSIAEIYSVNK